MNVLLLYPPNTRTTYVGRFTRTEPLTGIFLGPALRERHTLRLVDLRVRPRLEKELGGFVPDVAVVAVSPYSHGTLDTLLPRLKQLFPRLRILLVGAAEYGATHIAERPLDYAHPLVDAIVPEFYLYALQRVVPDVLSTWEDGWDLDDVPGLLVRGPHDHWEATADATYAPADIGVPDRTLLGRARGSYRMAGVGRMAYLIHTDGCPFNCRFCTMSKAGNDIFVRALPDVIEELEGITEPNVFLADFEPLQAPDAMMRLANSIEAAGIRKKYYLLTRADSVLNHAHVLERWRDIGLRWVFLGLDGHSAVRLREIGKGSSVATHEAALEVLERLGLCTSVGMTVPPDFGREDFDDLAHAVRRLAPSAIDFTVETPLVGTRLFDETEHRLTTRDWSLFDLQHAVLPTTLPLPEFYRQMTRLHVLAWRMSGPTLMRSHPFRDVLRNALQGPGAMWQSIRSARDHRRTPPMGVTA